MPGIMSDNDIAGQFAILLQMFTGKMWKEVWEYLGCPIHTFETIGLPRDAPDQEVWQECQKRDIILVTGNRNQEGSDSLETTLRKLNTLQSLPVFTLADPQRFMESREYAEQAAEKILELIQDIEHHRGAGRLYVP